MTSLLATRISSREELDEFFERQKGCVFRGQTKVYRDASGDISIPTSFQRLGCIPPLMLKWSYSAAEAIRVLSGAHRHEIRIELTQALLQHYGFRSFFVDLTASPAVACWFAAHRYRSKHAISVVEDCFETPIFVGNEVANYEPIQEEGYVFSIRRSLLENQPGKLIDLQAEFPADFRSRISAQQAMLFGPGERLPPESIVEYAAVPAGLLLEFASSSGFEKTATLFPRREDDAFLALLLSIPYEVLSERVGDSPGSGMLAARRGLPLPEYDYRFVKRLPPNIAFAEDEWLSRSMRAGRSRQDVCHFLVPDEVAFGSPSGPFSDLSPIWKAMGDCNLLIIETKGLVRRMEVWNGFEYSKGVVVERKGDAIVVSALTVEHPGTRVEGIGVEVGWNYRLEAGQLTRVPSAEDCPCNNTFRHQRHIDCLSVVAALLTGGELAPIGKRAYAMVGSKWGPTTSA